MTVSEQKTETWKPIPGAGYYEASDLGKIRSVDRNIDGRFYKGTVLKLREDPDGYLRVNITGDDRKRQHNVAVSRLVLLAHDPDGYQEGLEACHGAGGRKDNRLENLRWDTKDANREEALAVRLVNNPPRPKPPKVCPRCQKEHRGRGQNCHECVVKLGEEAAWLLARGLLLDKAAEQLDYPPVGVFNLAVKYGGLRCSVVADDEASVIRHPESPEPRLRRVLIRWKAWLQSSDAE